MVHVCNLRELQVSKQDLLPHLTPQPTQTHTNTCIQHRPVLTPNADVTAMPVTVCKMGLLKTTSTACIRSFNLLGGHKTTEKDAMVLIFAFYCPRLPLLRQVVRFSLT